MFRTFSPTEISTALVVLGRAGKAQLAPVNVASEQEPEAASDVLAVMLLQKQFGTAF